MKKRVLSLMLCAVMLLGAVPITPLAQVLTINAYAGDVTELQKVYDSVPPQEDWDLYIDTDVLEAYYKSAKRMIAAPLFYSQEDIDEVTKDLKQALDNLVFHTQSVTLDKTSVSVEVGKSETLTVSLGPEGAGDEVTWTSGNESYVTVEKISNTQAVITVKKYSKTNVNITATSNGKKAICSVTMLNPLSAVKLSNSSLSLFEDQTKALFASAVGIDNTATPTGDVFYTWSSNKTSIASVSDAGIVSANSPGTCTITVTAKDGKGTQVSAKCSVTVKQTVHITALSPITALSSSKLYMIVGETSPFKLTIVPSDASFKEIEWESSKPSVATVSDPKVSGSTATVTLSALKVGSTKITYKATDGSAVSGSFTLVVRPLVSSVEFEESIKVISTASTDEKFTAIIAPEDAGNQVLAWKSSDESVCSVDMNGVLYPKSNGVCTITGTTTDGSKLSASGTLRVAAKAKSVVIDRESAALDGGQKVTLKATVTTNDGETYNNVKWTSGNSKIATVDENGVVTGLYPGKVVIKATALDGSEKSDTCIINVTQSVTGVELSPAETVSTGDTITLVPVIVPSYATNQQVSWKSSDENIATVDPNGVVTGKNVGTVLITCTTADGAHTATCNVTVVISAQGVSLSKENVNIWVGYNYQLTATITPTSATNKEVVWSSSDESVATVTQTGYVKTVAGGSCYITATTVSGGYSAKCLFKVSEHPSGVALDYTVRNMYIGQVINLYATVLPETATNKDVAWSSSDPTVVTTTSTGKLTALSKGTAIITVKTEDGGYTATCAVTVGEKVSVEGLIFDVHAMQLAKGETANILATILPDNASEKGITWTSSNKSIATVSSSGVIKAVSVGEVVIKAVTKDGSFQQQCKVVVVQPVTGIILNSDNIKLAQGKSKTLKATISPADATDKTVIWSSSDENVATVSTSGVVSAKGPGIATVTATSRDGAYSASCNINVYIAVSAVKISAETTTIPKGEKRILTAEVIPANAENQSLTWTSSNTYVATVNEVGQVTARTKGTTRITVTSDDGGYTDSCIVEVIQLATGVSLDFTNISINAGKTKTLVATVTPSTASDRTVTWKSSNKSVATVNSKGVITAVSKGSAVITATSADGAASTYCKVTVNQPATGISVSKKTVGVAIGKTVTLKATVKPADVTNDTVTWKSANTSIATVSAKGVVKGLKAGKVKITATTSDGKFTATCTVTVYTSVKSVSLNKTAITLKNGSSTTITPTIKPSNATYKNVTWTSSNYDVATVNEKGKVTAKSAGYAEITATTNQGAKTAVCRVNVVNPVNGVSVSKTSIRIEPGDKYALKANIKPTNASNKTVSWKTSDKSIATVSSNGTVTAKKLGKVTITVTTADGGYSAKCTVNIVNKVKSVSLSKSAATLYLNKTLTLKATIAPADASNKAVTWSSSDKSIAKVSSKGVVTALKPGTATITVKTSDGSFTAKCVITVKRAVTKISLDKTTATLYSDKTLTLKATIAPVNATNKTVKWTTSNKKIATVSSSGVVTPVGKGTVTITATAENGLKASCKVTVYQKVTGVSLKESAIVFAGETLTLKATVTPSNANNPAVTWSTSDKSVATVSSTGVVTGVGPGEAVITVKTKDGGFISKCSVTVKQHVTSIELDKNNITVVIGSEHDLIATVKPDNATDKTYTFSSSDEKIVSVDEKGHFKALACGKATITVKANENNKSAKCVVTVIKPVDDIELDVSEITLYKGKVQIISVKLLPDDATPTDIIWTSDNPEVAVVNSSGFVTAVGKGTAILTARAKSNENAVKQCKVTVLLGVEEITTEKDEYIVYEGESINIVPTVLPEGAENPAVYWRSENTDIVTVDQKGNIKGNVKGEALVTIISNQNPEITKEVLIKVRRAVSEIKLDVSEKTLYNGESFTITPTVLPETADDTAVTYKSSDESVATVKKGVVTAKAGGEAIISVIAKDRGTVTAQCKVTVRQLPEKLTLNCEEKLLNVGDSFNLSATVLPENTFDKSVVFTVDNGDVVSVDDKGNIKALNKGEAVITATASDGKTKAMCKITVVLYAEKVEISASQLILEKGAEEALTAKVLPENASDTSIIWSSSDEKVVTVDKNGKLKAVGGGTATIKAMSTTDGVFAQCDVTVKVSSTAIALKEKEAVLYEGETLELKPVFTPEDTTNKEVFWSSSDESVVKIENGVIHALKKGGATVTVTALDTGVKTEIVVEVIKHVSSISISQTKAKLYMDGSLTLTATVLPEDAHDKSVIWSSSDKLIATVKDGVITPVRPGTAVISAKTNDGELFAICILEVLQGIEEISFDKNDVLLDWKESVRIHTAILPEKADDKTLIWTSSDESVAKVIDGVVSAQEKGGTAVIRATAINNPDIYCECLVTVKEPVTGITLSESEITMTVGQELTLTATVLPENATDKSLIWTSGDSSIVSVENGKLKALAVGVAEVTATTVNGYSAKCRITVTAENQQ